MIGINFAKTGYGMFANNEINRSTESREIVERWIEKKINEEIENGIKSPSLF